MKQYKVIGLMSGTSLDGVDIAYCVFTNDDQGWHYEIREADTVPYDDRWLTRLTRLHRQPCHVYPKTDAFYGRYLGMLTRNFIREKKLEVDFISSHGHTVFHQPDDGFTAQIGCGANIHAETGLPVINNFRVLDVALGGQGAPLVPVGDELLFGHYDACLNLGGFSNISFRSGEKRVAFDVSPCNIVMNEVAARLDLPYDAEGRIAASGTLHSPLLEALNSLPFYHRKGARSLGREWVEEVFGPVMLQYALGPEDLMATLNHHIAFQAGSVIRENGLRQVLVTGGGTFNQTLLDNLGRYAGIVPVIPDPMIIRFKEALIFAFLGVLKMEGRVNTLKAVTGSRRNSIGGCLWG